MCSGSEREHGEHPQRAVLRVQRHLPVPPEGLGKPPLPAPALPRQDLQRLGVDLGLERAALGIGAADLVAAVVDLDVIDQPAVLFGQRLHRATRLPAGDRRIAIVVGMNLKGRQGQHGDHGTERQFWFDHRPLANFQLG